MPDPLADNRAYRQEQRALLILIVYRALLASLLLAIVYGEFQLKISGPSNPDIFKWVSFGYIGMLGLSGLTFYKNWFSAGNQALAMFLLDCIIIPLLIHSGGGLTTALGSLLASSIALTSLLVRGRLVLFLAAIATFGIFSGQLYSSGFPGFDGRDYTQVGLLGAVYFAIALLAVTLSSRVRESESLAQQRAQELADLAQINQQIIQQMSTGVLVSNNQGEINYLNQAARRLLGISEARKPQNLSEANDQLAHLWRNWQEEPEFADSQTLETGPSQLRAHFSPSGIGNSCTLIFIEDASEAMRQARQIKLASLGRLTAGIAHQIRNPLSSISHASQLLAESEAISAADLRLLEIIRSNSKRVNDTIESILQLSRRQEPRREEIKPKAWLQRFIDSLVRRQGLQPEQVQLHCNIDCRLQVDSLQLEQVLSNLCENALRHSGRGAETQIQLRLDLDDIDQPRLSLCDNGAGLSTLALERLFEPFFTTRSDGTGLGLYIARELCEANNISLKPLSSASGACFQLLFRQGDAHG
ncbi:MAG: PAS domain-containing protein [Gammaproteobacteria bacterium]|nr:PAS domain-containing protein [Gammaproteobacteria bacterium]